MLPGLRLVLLLVLVCGGLVACGEEPDEAKREAASYEPLTTTSFATTINDAMTKVRSYVMTVDGAGSQISMSVSAGDDDQIEVQGTIVEGGESSDVIVVDERILVREEGEAKYAELPPAIAEMMFSQIADSTPAAQAEQLQRTLESVKYVGLVDVDGEELHDYEVTLGRAAVKKELEDKVGEKLDRLPDEFPLVMQIRLDPEHLIRRITISPGEEKVVIAADGWGEPVDIQVPPASEIEQIDLG